MKNLLDADNEIRYDDALKTRRVPMEIQKVFERLRRHFGSHKAAAKALAISYTRYNEWRWRPDEIPEAMRRYLILFADSADQARRTEGWGNPLQKQKRIGQAVNG